MKQAPALGVLWVWTVVRMDLMWAIGGLGVVGGVRWWRDEGIIKELGLGS